MDPKGRDEMLELIHDLAHNKNVNLILSSHLLPDVEYTCDHVVVMDKGQVAAQGPIDDLKGPAGRVFEVRIKGDLPGFIDALADGRHGDACDRRGRHARLRAVHGQPRERARSAGDLLDCRAPSGCRSGTCGRAFPRSRTCSRRPSEKSSVPIHDQSYRRYGGGKARPGAAWMVIARAGIVSMVRKRIFIGLMIFAWLPFIVRAVQVYVATNFPQAALLAPTAETFREYLEQQNFFVFFVTIWVGAGLIASDRRANALQIYLSKPLLRSEYIAGKAAVLVFFLLLVTWVPAMLLLLVQVMFAGNFQFLQKNLFLFPAITVASLLQVLLASLTMLALSSLSKSSRYVAILYTGIIMFTLAIFGFLTLITGSTAMSWISPSQSASQVIDVIFRVPPRYVTPWQVSLLVIVAFIVVSISILERRVRGVEVVT